LLIWINALSTHLRSVEKPPFSAMASAREEVIMTMQSDHNGRGGLANNLTLQLGLLAAAVIVVLYVAAHYIW
jgi:hypothetical protein